MTSSGHIRAVGEKSHVKEGDRVRVILGGDTPFILRREKDDTGYRDGCQESKPMLGSGFMTIIDGKHLEPFEGEPLHPHRLWIHAISAVRWMAKSFQLREKMRLNFLL